MSGLQMSQLKIHMPRPLEIVAGRYVKISVTDAGTGIDDAIKEKIFDPFFSTKDIGQGSGLGLSSVYGIIKKPQWFHQRLQRKR